MPSIEELKDAIGVMAGNKVDTETFNSSIEELKAMVEKRTKDISEDIKKDHGTIDEKVLQLQEDFKKQLADAVKEMGTAFINTSQNKNSDLPDEKIYGKTLGEFLWKVKSNDIELKALAENAGSSGGYLVPNYWSREILKIALERSFVRDLRPTRIDLPGPVFDIPSIISTSRSGSYYGGIKTYWGTENTDLEAGESDPKFGKVSLNACKLYGYTESYEDLTRDSIVTIGQLLQDLFGKAIAFEEDYTFIQGDGVGKPLGILSSPCLATVSRATASQIHTIDIVNCLARFTGDLSNAAFLANQETLPYLYTLSDRAGNYVWIPGMNGNIAGRSPGSLYGVPLIITEKVPALGTKGDLTLGDFSNYVIGDLEGLRIEESTHWKFGPDKRAWKIVKRVDGKPWLDSKITPKQGSSTLSPFVAVE